MIDAAPADLPEQAAAPAPRASLLAWVHEGARTLAFCWPRWERLHATPAMLALLLALSMLVSVGAGRLYFDGDALFSWRSMLAGWSPFVLTIWACYVLRRAPRSDPRTAPDSAHLIALLLAQSLCLSLVMHTIALAMKYSGRFDDPAIWVSWLVWLTPVLWGSLAQLFAMMRAGDRELSSRVQAIYAFALACAIGYYFAPHPDYWREKPVADAERLEPLRFTQDSVEAQAPLLEEKVAALKPQRDGIADMYTITFAPYEGEEVFRRESRMVSEVMAKRFDAAGRGLQLLNHREHLEDMPWATPLNLQRAIEGVAATMNLDEDVLFIHLTSHGARDGELAAEFWPLDVEPVTPPELRKWLDEAGIKHRVISISACFAGSWIDALASDDTLVMTASDADHTSYGCGKKSPLTFFGRAMYDEQLRTTTLSFEDAHAASRKIIDKREKEAGKSDGYSNPQIKVGSAIKPYLAKMRARLGG
ncbi:MAG: C13 family peptidase [Pseudomonadota bacterium]